MVRFRACACAHVTGTLARYDRLRQCRVLFVTLAYLNVDRSLKLPFELDRDTLKLCLNIDECAGKLYTSHPVTLSARRSQTDFKQRHFLLVEYETH